MKISELVAAMLLEVSRFNKEIVGINPTKTAPIEGERKKWAVTAMREELKEFQEAKTTIEQADSLVDLIYFALGRLYEMGASPAIVFAEVHKANMAKKQGELSKRPGSMGHDAIKPEGWKPPDHEWLGKEYALDAIQLYESISPVLKRIVLLRAKKGQDYNSGGVALTDYFPFGHQSYAQMVYLKAMRVRSLVELLNSGKKPNFEGLKDTLEDLLNYATYYAEWVEKEAGK